MGESCQVVGDVNVFTEFQTRNYNNLLNRRFLSVTIKFDDLSRHVRACIIPGNYTLIKRAK